MAKKIIKKNDDESVVSSEPIMEDTIEKTEDIGEPIEVIEAEIEVIEMEPIDAPHVEQSEEFDDIETLHIKIANYEKEIQELRKEISILKGQASGNIAYAYNRYDDVYYPSAYQRKRFTVFAQQGISNNGPLYRLYCKSDETELELIPESLLIPANSFID